MSALEFDVRLHAEQLDKDIAAINQKLDGFTKQAQDGVGKLDTSFSGLGSTIAGMFAAGVVTAFTSDLIQAAGESYKAEAKVAQAVKHTGEAAGFTADELGKMAKALQEVTTFEDDKILNDVTAQLLTFTNITGANFERAQKAVLDLATVIDGDLKGAAIRVGKALNDPDTALTGLTRSGVQLSAVQKEQIENLIKQNRLFDAQTIILNEINHQYGGQAEAMAKMPIGKIEQLKNAWGDVKEEMGKLILESKLVQGAVSETAKSLYIQNSQLSYYDKWVAGWFESQDKTYEKAKQANEEYEKRKEILKSLEQEESTYTPPDIAKTVNQQVISLKESISKVNDELSDLRRGDVVANIPAIEAKEEQLKTLTSQLESLTGVSKKAAEESQKVEKERLEALENLSKSELELKRSTEAAKIAIMQDGAAKQIAEAQLAYEKEMDSIQRQKTEMEKLLSQSGLKVGTAEYDKQQETIKADTTNAEKAAAEKLAADKVKIEKEAAEKIKAIRKEITDAFLVEQNRELVAVNDKWDKIINEINKSGIGTDDEISKAESARTAELLATHKKYAMERIAIDEDIALRNQDIMNRSMEDQTTAQQKMLRIQKTYAQVRIAQLEKLGKEENKAEIDNLKSNISGIDAEMTKLEYNRLQDIVSGIGQINSAMGETLSRLLNIGRETQKLIENLGTGGSTLGAIGNVVGIISTIYGQIDKFNTQQQESIASMLEVQNDAINRQIDLLDRLYGSERTEAEQAVIDKLKGQIDVYNDLAKNTKATIQAKYSVDPFGIIKGWSTIGREKFKDVQEMIDWLNNPELQKDILSGDFRIKNIDYIQKIIGDYNSARDQLEELTEQEMTVRLGFDVGTVADDIAQGIEDGLKLSEGGLGDWTENFGDLLRTTLSSQIKAALEKKFLTKFMESFNDAMIDDKLTGLEVSDLESLYATAIKDSQALWDSLSPVLAKYTDLANGSDTDESGLTGAIKGITEETASLIAGQFYAMREYQSKTYMTGLEQLDLVNQSVTHLAEIAANTRDISKLNSIDQRLSDMNNYLKASL